MDIGDIGHRCMDIGDIGAWTVGDIGVWTVGDIGVWTVGDIGHRQMRHRCMNCRKTMLLIKRMYTHDSDKM